MNKVQASKWTMRALVGAIIALGCVALVLNFSNRVEANGIQQLMLIGVASTEANPTLFVASPQHNSTQQSNVVHYNARFSWIDCGNEAGQAFVKVYEHKNGGKVSNKGNGEGSSEWNRLGENSKPLVYGPHGRVGAEVTLTGDFTLTSLNACGSTTLWTIAGAKGTTRGAIIHDFTWLNRVGCATPTATPTPTMTPTPTPTPTSQCSDGIDNDGDGATDMNDFSCSNSGDNDETNPKAACQDGVDNDGDGKTDMDDPGCSNRQDNDESNATATPTPTPEVRVNCADGSQIIVTSTNSNVNCNNNVITLNVDNSSNNNNSSSNSSKSESKNENNHSGNVSVVQNTGKVAAAHVVVPTFVPAPVVHVPVTAKTGAEGVATLLVSTLTGASGLAYVVRKAIIG